MQAKHNKTHFGAKWKRKPLKWDKVVVYILIPEAPAENDKIGSFIQASAGAPDAHRRARRTQTDTRRLTRTRNTTRSSRTEGQGADC